MPSRPNERVVLSLLITWTFVVGLLAVATAQELPSTTTDGTVLTSEETTTLLNRIKDRFDAVKQPSEWVDDLLKDLPGVRFADDLGDTQALYQPASQGPLGRSGDTLYLRAGLDLNRLTDSQLGLITHELWHAWFDFVPTYVPVFGSALGRMSNAQDEAMGGFVEQLAAGNTLGDAISGAIAEVLHWEGTAQDAVNAIEIVERHLGGSFFSNGLPTTRDVDRWARIRHRYPEVAQLDAHLSESDRARVEARAAELVAIDAQPDDLLSGSEPEPEPASASPAAPSADPTATSRSAGSATPSPPPEPPSDSTPPATDAAGATDTAALPAPAPEARDTVEAAAAVPDCAPCVPIAQKLRDAMRQRQALQAEVDQITQRLGQIPAELKRAQQARDDLRAEYERRLRQTRVRSGRLEAGYYEVGNTVYIGLGTTRDGAFVPDVVPDPDAPQDFGDASGPRRSPYMTRLKSRLDAADGVLANLRAEQGRLNARLGKLAAQLAAAGAAIQTLERELDECLKTCGLSGPIRIGFDAVTLPALPSALGGDSAVSILSGNPTDRLSGLNLYALQTPDGVPYALARPEAPVDDRYQLFIVTFIRMGRTPEGPPGGGAGRAANGRGLRRVSMASGNRPIVTHAAATPAAGNASTHDRSPPALSIAATGASSGDALTLELIDAGDGPLEIVAPDGLVLEAVRPGAATAVSESGRPVLSTSVTGFCLEFQKPPPPPGTIYQVAPEAVQERYRAVRPVLEAGRALAEGGLLNPDSDPDSYATFIQQWAVWVQLEGWDEAAFTREFAAHTRRNVEEAGETFTDEMRQTLEGVAPDRFKDILAVLVEADGLTGRLPFQPMP